MVKERRKKRLTSGAINTGVPIKDAVRIESIWLLDTPKSDNFA